VGGNAVDAAIASTLCIGVINAFATGKSTLSIFFFF
jgi:gamma-glutamyltranspeptidase